MKILVLTSRLPYPIEKGDKLRIYHQIRELSKRHEIFLCSLVEEKPTTEDVDHLRTYCVEIHTFPLKKVGIIFNVLKAFATGQSLQVAYFYRKSIHQKIQALTKRINPDFVYCQLIRMSEYAKRLNVPAALDYMDCFSEGMSRQAREGKKWQKSIFERESKLLKNYQQEIYPVFDYHSIISGQDKKLLDPNGELDIHIVPNGIDGEFFKPTPTVEEYDLVFVGNMGYFPNVNAARYLVRNVMPWVWAELSEAKVLIAGARPHTEVQKLGLLSGIHVSGWVPDIRDAYASGKVFVAPIFAGSGQQNKILEAMAMEKPCITSPLVNNAIHANPGSEIEIASTEEEFAEKIVGLLRSTERQKSIGQNGRRFILKQYSWAQSVQKIEGWMGNTLPTSN